MSLCVFLRVPPLFIIDKIFSINFGFQDSDGIIITLYNIFGNNILSQFENGYHVQYFKPILLLFCLFMKIIASYLIFWFSLCILVLPTRYMYPVYLHVAPICVVFFSSLANIQTMNVLSKQYAFLEIDTINKVLTWDVDVIIHHFTQLQIFNFLCLLFSNITLQFFLSLGFNFLQVCTTNHSTYKVACITFMIPTLLIIITGAQGFLSKVTILLLTLLPLFILPKKFWLNIFTIMNLIYNGYNHIRENINNYVVMDRILMEWSRLKMSSVLQLFWALRLLDLFMLSMLTKEFKYETLFGTVKYLLVKGCDTITAVLAMTSFVSYFSHNIAVFFRWVLSTEDMEIMSIGNRSALLFFLLALQSGLTSLELEECFIQLCLNISLTCDFLLFNIFCLVEPLLSSLSVNQNRSIKKHLRALFVSGFIIMFSIIMLRYVWNCHFPNNWLLEFISINFQIIIKVLVTLAIYSLHMIDSYQNTLWEKLDDYEFYIKTSGGVADFCFSIIIFLNGVYGVIFESFTIASVSLVCLHGYCAIWRCIKDGWRVLNRRRVAIKKVELLADATSVQLSEFDDICSICRHNMDSAKITNCNHYFHQICLRKWLNLKDNCPLCHNILSQA